MGLGVCCCDVGLAVAGFGNQTEVGHLLDS